MSPNNLTLAQRLALEMDRKVRSYITRREFDITHEEALNGLLGASVQGEAFRTELTRRCEEASLIFQHTGD